MEDPTDAIPRHKEKRLLGRNAASKAGLPTTADTSDNGIVTGGDCGSLRISSACLLKVRKPWGTCDLSDFMVRGALLRIAANLRFERNSFALFQGMVRLPAPWLRKMIALGLAATI
jgi:hypothetical protein